MEIQWESILNHLGNMSVYVVRRDTHEILYFNEQVKKMTPHVKLGAVCHELWGGFCTPCPLDEIGDKEFNTVVNHTDPFFDIVDITATKMDWGKDKIPAYLISVKPHTQSVEERQEQLLNTTLDTVISSAFDEVIYLNLTTDEVVLQKNNRGSAPPGELRDAGFEQNLIRSMHPRDRDLFRQKFSRQALLAAFQQGIERVQQDGLRKGWDGQYHWISLEVVHLEDSQDGDVMVLVLVTTIDRTKKLEFDSRMMIASILTLFDELIILDLQTKKYVVYKADESTAATLAVSEPAEFAPHNLYYGQTLVHPDDQDNFFHFFHLENMEEQIKKGNRKFITEVRRKNGAGEYRWCEMMGTAIERDTRDGFNILLTFRDIDELHLAKQEKEAANLRFMHAVNSFYDAIYELDFDTGNITGWKAAEPDLRSAMQEAKWPKWAANFQNVHEDYREKAKETLSWNAMKQAFSSGSTEVTLDIPIIGGDGNYRWFSIQAQLLGNTRSMLAMVYIKNIDATKKEEERKKVALRDALALAEQSNSAKSDFFSRMSHDIRTPMNAILGMSQIAQMNLRDPERIADCLDKINVSVKFLLSLINDVLDMSKIESGKMAVSREAFDLRQLLGELETIVIQQATQKEQTFNVEIWEQVGQFYWGDPLRIKQVLMNLLSNAIKYTPPHGSIKLQVRIKRVVNNISYVRMSVTDNGIGISKEFQSRIFLPFEQEHQGNAHGLEGTGLGLSISRNLIHLMNGEITVVSELGQGSEFIVVLPLEGADSPQEYVKERIEEAIPPVLLDGVRILLVEDNDLNLEIAKSLLEMGGVTVETARDGQEALDRFEGMEPGYFDAIFMDIRMPVMDGLEATRRIRSLPRADARRIPVIAMTANAFLNEQEEAKRAGITAYLSKPIERDLLYEVLKNEISRARADSGSPVSP